MTTADRLGYHRNPARMFTTPAPWRATAYLTGHLVVGTPLFALTLAMLVVVGVLNISWLGLPLLVGAAEVIRGAATVVRWQAGLLGGVVTPDRPVTDGGLLAAAKAWWTDTPTLRTTGYLLLFFLPLLVIDVVALALWIATLAGVALPLWYWSVPRGWPSEPDAHGVLLGLYPNGEGGGRLGVWVGDLPTALMAAVVFLVLAFLISYVVVAAARLHRWAARAMLGPPVDPLAAAKQMLAAPGPLIL